MTIIVELQIFKVISNYYATDQKHTFLQTDIAIKNFKFYKVISYLFQIKNYCRLFASTSFKHTILLTAYNRKDTAPVHVGRIKFVSVFSTITFSAD